MHYKNLFENLITYIARGVVSLDTAEKMLQDANEAFDIEAFIMTDSDEFIRTFNQFNDTTIILGEYILPRKSLLDFLQPHEEKILQKRCTGMTFSGEGKLKKITISCSINDKINVPCVHMDGDGFHAAVSLNEAKYYTDDPYVNIFYDETQCRIFDQFMASNFIGRLSRWEVACNLFNNNGIETTIEQPNYYDLIERQVIH